MATAPEPRLQGARHPAGAGLRRPAGLRGPLGWLGEEGSPQFGGALYEGTSIAAVYGTTCSLVWESWGSPELWYASTRKPRGKHTDQYLRKTTMDREI